MKRMLTSCSMTNLPNGASCSMTNLPQEVILHISSYLDIFHVFQLAHTNKNMRQLLYNSNLQTQINEYFTKIRVLRLSMFRFIRRINTDGVVYGVCEQCSRHALLYTQSNGEEDERCICLDDCVSYCVECNYSFKYHHRYSGCPLCRRVIISSLLVI